jgi:hypothetical protein
VFRTTALVNALFGSGYYEAHGWPKPVMGVTAGTLSSSAGFVLNRGQPATDPQTGQQVLIKGQHSLFFIPMQYWGPLIVVLVTIVTFI